jgi:hypothetical protein
MRREIELRPDKTEMREFRAEMNVELTKTLRGAQEECARIEHALSLQLSESVLGENQWKSQFEESMGARIQDVWSGVHAASTKLQESMQMLQTDMIKQEEITREVSDVVHQMRAKTLALEQESREHASSLQENSKGLDHVHSQCVSLERTLSLHESDVTNRFAALIARVDATDTRVSACQATHEVFASDTDKTLASLASDLAAVQSMLGTHHGSLQMLDAGLTRQGAEAMRMGERMDKTDMRVGGIDGRLVSAEKKLATAGNVIQEHYQEMLHLVGDVKVIVDQAAHDRAGIKRVTADISYSLQETQQTLLEVSKVASTTEIALARTAAEIPKIGALVSTNSANIAKNRQTIRDLTAMADDEKSFSQALQSRFDKEVVSTNARFTEVAIRDETTQQAIVDAGNTTMNVKHTLEEAIRYNGNLIHQLNTMVDSIAITESAEGMEDKMAKFALACAELGLKLEHFGKNAPTSSPSSLSSSSSSTSSSTFESSKTDTKAELALLLTKVIRFLGSGVSIDQNKYLLAAKRTHYVDPSSGAVIIELPPQQVLEGFRTSKATAFVAKTRLFMDQMHPVVPTNKYAIEFRDALARKLQFVLEFGLANLFPNTGRPLSAANKRGGEFGTCIACDRPIDSPEEQRRCESRASMLIADPGGAAVRAGLVDATQQHQQDPPMSPESSSFADNAIAEEHRLRRQRIIAGGSAFVSNRIDTKSVIPGRSGVARGVRPKSGHEPMHQAPGKADFVYRGGFRIPKPTAASSAATASNMPSVESVLLAGIVASTKSDDHQSANQQQPSLVDGPLGSRLEKVALLGRCQSVDIPTIIPNADSKQPSTLVRPHTAPYRAKSLPKLIDAPSGGIGGAGAAAAAAGSPSIGGMTSTASLPGA